MIDSTILGNPMEALDFVTSALQAVTECSIIGESLDGTILLWNEGAHHIYGYEPEEVLGKVNSSILHVPEDIAAGNHHVMTQTALQDGKWEGAIRCIRKNGERFTAQMVATPRQDVSGKPIGFLLVSKDISNEIRFTEQLKATPLHTYSLIESNIDALITTDPFGFITDVNQQMEILTGCTREKLIGTPFKNYFTDPVRAEEGIKLVLCKEKVVDYELSVPNLNGRITAVSFNGSTFNDVQGKLQGVFAAVREVTERKCFEQALEKKNIELKKANFAKSRFLASMSHELRTPLNAIIGFTGTLLMKLPGPLNADQENQLQTIESSATHLLSLINDLLDLAKIESGKFSLKLEPVVCQQAIDDVATALRPLALSKGLKFSVFSPSDDLVIETDRRALSQIMINLVNNAIKYTEKGEIGIELVQHRKNGHIVTKISITDTGVGIRDEDQQKLFQAFEQLESSSIRRFEGSGLGLHISQKLIDLLGGHIIFNSQFGKGSTFTIIFDHM
jgi:PAS domain S-box-containing protein